MRDFPLGVFGALRIVGSDQLADTKEDWSKVRSPGRAARRRKRGHKQRITTKITPRDEAIIDRSSGTVFVHPSKLASLKEALKREEVLDRAVIDGPVKEPARALDVERLNMEAFACAHKGIWSPNQRARRFERFPDEMGGDAAQAKIYAEHARTGSHYQVWLLPNEHPELSLPELGAVGPQRTIECITFQFHRIAIGRQIKTVLAFASDEDEKTFYGRLRAIRLSNAREDARWGFKELALKAPPPHPY